MFVVVVIRCCLVVRRCRHHKEWFLEKLLTVDQVADRLQVNEQTVRRWLRDGELMGIAFGGRTGWRVSSEDLATFLDRRREEAELGKAAA